MNRQTLMISMTLCTLCTFYACSRSSSQEEVTPHQEREAAYPQPQQRPIQPQPRPIQPQSRAAQPQPTYSNLPVSKPAQEDRIRGKVVETMNSGGYTYVSVLTPSGEIFWAAGRRTPIKVGDTLDIKKEMEMNNFTSKTLGRTFKSIYFVSALKKDTTQPKPRPRSRFPQLSAPTAKRAPVHPANTHSANTDPTHTDSHSPRPNTHAATTLGFGSPLGSPQPANPSHNSSSSSSGARAISVTKAAGGYTIAELFAQSLMLAGKEVSVRGKVVKFNSSIMNRNWIHIQDGTGSATTQTHDLTVTSNYVVSVGDTVLVKGRLAIDQNIGAGYQYPVLIEQATFTR